MLKTIPVSALEQNIPEWQIWAVVITVFIAMLVTVVWGYILEQRYTGPYTLLSASSGQKWKWAVTVMFWETLIIPLMGLITLAIPDPDQWFVFPLFCTGLWIVIFPIAVIFKRWGFERQLKSYRRVSKIARAGGYRTFSSSPLTGWTRFLMNAESRQFFEQGFSEGEDISWPLIDVSMKLADNTDAETKWFRQEYPEEQILHTSPMSVLEVKEKTHVGRSYRRFFQSQGVCIITSQILLLKTKFFSLYTLFYLTIAAIPFIAALGLQYLVSSFYLQAINGEVGMLIFPFFVLFPTLILLTLSVIFGLSVFQRRPYRKEIKLDEIKEFEIDEHQGMMGKYDSLLITTNEKTLNIVLNNNLPEEIVQTLRYYSR